MRDDRLFEIEYGYWFNLANERFYRHVDVVLNLVQLVGGSTAALGAMQKSPEAVVASGLALALCAALSLLVSPGVKVEQHRICKGQWRVLRGKALTLDDTALLLAVTDIQGTGPAGIGALAVPAYNSTVLASGRGDAARDLSTWQWVVARLA
jgi:hypothetical protein